MKDKDEKKKKYQKSVVSTKVRKAGKTSRPGWKKPKQRHHDPWRLIDGHCNQNLIATTTVADLRLCQHFATKREKQSEP